MSIIRKLSGVIHCVSIKNNPALIRWGGKIYHPQLHVFNKTFQPKIIIIQQRLLELQRKMSGVFFYWDTVYMDNSQLMQLHCVERGTFFWNSIYMDNGGPFYVSAQDKSRTQWKQCIKHAVRSLWATATITLTILLLHQYEQFALYNIIELFRITVGLTMGRAV